MPVDDTSDWTAAGRLSFIYLLLTDNSNKEHSFSLCCQSRCVDVLFSRDRLDSILIKHKNATEQQCYRPVDICDIWPQVLHDSLKCQGHTISVGSKEKNSTRTVKLYFCNVFFWNIFKMFVGHEHRVKYFKQTLTKLWCLQDKNLKNN